MDVGARKELIADRFQAEFGQAPTVWVQAPGRVDLMGSHTDYDEGVVLTQAIDRNTWIAAAPGKLGRALTATWLLLRKMTRLLRLLNS